MALIHRICTVFVLEKSEETKRKVKRNFGYWTLDWTHVSGEPTKLEPHRNTYHCSECLMKKGNGVGG